MRKKKRKRRTMGNESKGFSKLKSAMTDVDSTQQRVEATYALVCPMGPMMNAD